MRIVFVKIILSFFIIFSCKGQDKCDELNKGTFKLYNNGKEIGKIYRKNNIQIEKYLGDKAYTIAFFNNKNHCNYYLKSYYIKNDFDTITVLVSYRKIEDRVKTYSFEMKAAYIDTLSYQYKGELKKISDNINNKEVLKLFEELKEK